MVRQIFNEILKQNENEFTPEGTEEEKIKVIFKKKKSGKCWKLPPDLLFQRYTNCSRQYCTADYIHDLTENKRKIRQDSEAHTRQQTTLRRTE